MKIYSIGIKNLHSLKGEHFIDLQDDRIKNSDIFAITGATGSGKSTILDAITLALYNQTPRSGKITESNVEANGFVLTKGCDDCYAEIIYESNGKKYRSTWSMRRKRTGKLENYQMELSDMADLKSLTQKPSDVPEKNAEIIGLNYDQFIKTILLSQGEFAKFLKAPSKERTDILEKITGTNIYRDLGRKCFEITKEIKQQKDNLDLLVKDKKTQIPEQETVNVWIETGVNSEKKQLEIEAIVKKLSQLAKIKESIQSNRNSFAEQDLKLKNIESERKNFETDWTKLLKHKTLIPYVIDFSKLEDIQKSIQTLTLKIQELNTQKNTTQTAIQNTENQRKNANTHTQLTKEKLDKKLPEIQQAKEILTELKGLLQKDKELTDQLKTIEYEQTKTTNEINILQKSTKTAIDEKKNTDQWLEANQHLTILPNIKGQIQSKIQALNELRTNVENLLSSKDILTILPDIKTSKTINDKKKLIETQLDTSEKKLKTLQSELEIIPESNADIDLTIHNLQNKIALLNKTEICLGRKTDAQKIVSENTKKNEEINIKIQENEINIDNTKKETEIATLKKEELTIKKNRQLLEQKYEKDRANLKPNEPCFLCGSSVHPYIQNYENTIQQTEKDQIDLDSLLQKLNAKRIENEKILASLRTDQKFATQLIQTNGKLLGELDIEMNELLNTLKIESIDNETLAKSIHDNNAELKRTEQYRSNINHQKQLENQLLLLRNGREKIEQLNQIYKDILSVSEPIVAHINKLAPDAILPKIDELWETYQQQRKRCDELDKTIALDNQNLKQKNDLLSKIAVDIATLQSSVLSLQTIISNKDNQRKELTGNVLPDILEDNLRKELEKAMDTETALNNKLTEYNTTLHQLSINITNEEIELTTISQHRNELNQYLLTELKKLNIESLEEGKKCLLKNETIVEIENNNTRIQKLIHQIQQSISDLQNQFHELSQNDNTEISNEELKKNIEDNEAQYKQLISNTGNAKAKLEEYHKNLQIFDKLNVELAEKNKDYVRWSKLNEQIGDGTGTKFSEYAQEFTLRQMIVLANKHLQVLSDRYQIFRSEQSTKEKDLYITDHYQAEAVRSVNTLSGGETFLVSLAMALGLSDLAGQYIHIDCLFIDEGFGTLDPNSLDIALNALERLQTNTNKTIGVISHVELLKERIKTHIHLKKGSNGYSTLSIE